MSGTEYFCHGISDAYIKKWIRPIHTNNNKYFWYQAVENYDTKSKRTLY